MAWFWYSYFVTRQFRVPSHIDTPLIIYVDDDPDQLEAMAVRLEPALSCRVLPAATIAEGKRLVDEHRRNVDLVITDLHFGDEDKEAGLRLVEHVARLRGAYIPIIVLTGKGNTEIAVKSMELGAFSYIEKGMPDNGTARILLQKARHAFRRRSLEEALRKKQGERRKYLKHVRSELNRARGLQAAFCPQGPVVTKYCHIAYRCEQCDEVGGDLCAFGPASETETYLLVGDIKGHGVVAALLAAMLRAAVDAARSESPTPQAVLATLANTTVFLRPPAFATLFYGLLDSSGKLSYFSAGHPEAFIQGALAPAERLTSSGPLLTNLQGESTARKVKVKELYLKVGDRLLVYTDGVVESRGPSGKEFGEERLLAVLCGGRELPSEALLRSIVNQLDEFRERGRRAIEDDRTLLIATYTGEGSSGSKF